MFWALAAERIDLRGFEFEHVLRDIQTLNEWALEGRLETTAISLHAYPYVQDRYAVLPHGASMGSGYGPIVVAREPITREQLQAVEVVVPGRMTTAFLVLRLYLGDFPFREVPFDEVLDDSIQAGLDNRGEAMEYALGFGRGLDTELADRFVGMYVNDYTCDYGEEGRVGGGELPPPGGGAGAVPAPGFPFFF